jgi:AraC-like DNA-binding protein
MARLPEHVAPPSPLGTIVDAFWQSEGTGGLIRVLPDGCMDFIFDLERGTARLVGAMTEAVLVQVRPGDRCIGVRFKPGAVAPYLDASAAEVVDGDAPLVDVSRARRFALAERVAEAPDDAARRRLLADFLLDTRARLRAPDPRLRRAVRFLREHTGKGAVRSLAIELGLGERQLERLFSAHVGLGPKAFSRVARLERAIALMGGSVRGQAALASLAGYSDESHLIREFRALTLTTPAELARERHVGFIQST